MSSKPNTPRKSLLAMLLFLATTVSTLVEVQAKISDGAAAGRHLQSLDKAVNDAQAASGAAAFEAALDAHPDKDLTAPTTLVQIHVITRHGARTMLSKDADTLSENGGATLTPMGQQQLYELGTWLRERYEDALGEDGNSLKHYNPALHRLESSNLDRTLTSANSLAMGLFPSKTRATGIRNNIDDDQSESMLYTSPLLSAPAIPIYSDGNDVNDVTLRAYRNCPTFHERLQNDLYPSQDWKSLEFLHTDLLTKLGGIFPEYAVDGMIPLTDVWNVYDPIHVARTECMDNDNDNDGDGDDNPKDADDYDYDSCSAFVTHKTLASAISAEEFVTLERLTERIEHLKFGRGLNEAVQPGPITAGNLLGSNLLWKILNRSRSDGNFFLYSAHLPTLLGFLSTLQATEDFYAASGGERFVDYGAALIVEIHKKVEKDEYYFSLKYKSSETENAVTVVLKESKTGVKCGQEFPDLPNMPMRFSWCSLDEIVTWAKENTIITEQAWCEACNNRMADVCLRTTSVNDDNFSENDSWVTSSSSEFMGYGYEESSKSTIIIASTFFGGFLSGIVLMGLVWCSAGCCNKRKRTGKTIEPPSTADSSPTITIAITAPTTSDIDDNKVVDNNEEIHANNVDDNDIAEKLDGKEIC